MHLMREKKELYHTAVYLRLSKGDGDVDGRNKAESNSITNQRAICLDFIRRHTDMELADIYIDDGFTGTNFNRPEMKRMMADADDGKIDCIVVKDLSRFGRERIETGTYIAKTFKAKGIRFIAINDHYDTLTADGSETNIVMPIKALTNDNFSRDISSKVRSSQEIKREKGEFIGAFAPYGYKKDPENKNLLVPDDYAAGVVRDIFAMKIDGMAANAIADELNAAGVLSPSEYKRGQGEKFSTSFGKGSRAKWSAQAVLRILKNEVYIGTLAQGKRMKVSYKVKKEIRRPREEWVRIENAHEPVVDRRTFDCVQELLERDTIRRPGERKPYLFAGMLYCADCGMSMIRRSGKSGVYYICSNYNRGGGCSRHTVKEDLLREVVLKTLQKWIDVLADRDAVAKKLRQMDLDFDAAAAHDGEIVRLQEELTKCDMLKSSLYQDLKDGLLNEAQFNRYREEYTNRGIRLREAVAEQEKIIRTIFDRGVSCGMDLEEMRRDLKVGKLDRVLLATLVDRILIHENGDIEIILRLSRVVGKLDTIVKETGFIPDEREAG